MAKHYRGGRMKNKLMWFYHCWNSVMDLKYNPIGYVRDTSVQMYLMIVLSIPVSYTHLTLPTKRIV